MAKDKIKRKAKIKPIQHYRCALCIDKKEYPENEMWFDKYYKQHLCMPHKAERFHHMTTAVPHPEFRSWAAENFNNEELMEMEKKYGRYDDA